MNTSVLVFFLCFFSLSLARPQQTYSIIASDQTAILNVMNQERNAWGNYVNLVWDAGLASDSATYSTTCIFQHSPNPGRVYGENIAYSWVPDPSSFPVNMVTSHITDPSVGWIGSEEPNWICTNPWAVSDVLHFTQIIWKNTTKVGCGISLCDPGTISSSDYTQFFVCRFSVAGNVEPDHPLTCTLTIPSPCTRSFSTNSPPPSTPPPSTPPPSTPPTHPTTPPTNPPTHPTTPPSNPPTHPTTPPSNPPTHPTTPPTNPPTHTTTPPSKSPPTSPPSKVPPTSPPSSSWSTCTANYDPNGKVTVMPCVGQPWNSGSNWYCPCNAPDGQSWSLTKPSCYQPASQAVADPNAEQGSPTLSVAAWVGIGVGVAAGVIVIVVVVVVLLRNRSQKTQENF